MNDPSVTDSQTAINLAEHQFRTEVKVDSNGVGRASIRGVARLADVNDGGLSKSLKTGAELEPSKLAVFLMQQGFEGADLAKFSETGIPDLAIASILEYYAFEAGRYCSDNAKIVYRAFARMGIRTWMQRLVNWQPQGTTTDLREFVIQQLPATPKAWQCRFKPEFWAALERLYGLKQNKRACGMFISHWVYGYFPVEVRDRIDEINPRIETGRRKNLIHPHFDDVLEKALEMQISLVTSNLIRAKSRNHFKRLMKQARRYSFTLKNLQQINRGN